MSTRSTTPPAALDAGFVLMRLVAARTALDAEIAEQVAQVRALGGSWTTVAIALDVSKQAAQQRYGTDLGASIQTR